MGLKVMTPGTQRSIQRLIGAILLALSTIASPAASQPPSPTQNDAIIFERTVCLGRCPSYRITIFNDGGFVWEGYAHVKVEGISRGVLPPNAFDQLIAALRAHSYWSFERQYLYGLPICRQSWTDSPGVSILVQRAGKRKSVQHDLGCRGFDREAELIELENKLDQIMGTKRWVTGD